MTRYEQIMRGAAIYAGYYRRNPHRFVHDYLHVELKLFQKILIAMMNISVVVAFIGARGIGKSFLSAIFCVIRAILYPGSKICVASGVRSQAINVLEKIMLELKPNSPELAAEIDDKQTRINNTSAQIVFKNGSYIKVVTASDSARGNRATVLLLDEFRLVKKDVVDTILKKFLTQRRMPKYSELTKDERLIEYAKEKNMTMYLSSAYWMDSWAYTKCADTCEMMLSDNKNQFVCGLPYQLSIAEGLLDPDLIADEMAETNFSPIKFSMEYESLFYGVGDESFFEFDTVSKNRHIKYPMLPDKLAAKLGNAQQVRIPPKQNGEKRILSVDVALMASKKHKNDATAIFVNQLMPTKSGRYISNIVYADSYEGLRTEEQALIVRRMFDEYECDYIVLDCASMGLGIFDCLSRELTDEDTGEIYPALSCCNNPEMAARCTSPNADKVIWSIKASASFNSDIAILLREGLKSGRIRLLVNEYDGDSYLSEFKGYASLNPQEKIRLQMPYYHTTLLVDELTKLQHEESNGKIKVYERSGMRKDRYSSLAYNFYVATLLEAKLSRKKASGGSGPEAFVIRPPSKTRKAVIDGYGRKNRSGWYS